MSNPKYTFFASYKNRLYINDLEAETLEEARIKAKEIFMDNGYDMYRPFIVNIIDELPYYEWCGEIRAEEERWRQEEKELRDKAEYERLKAKFGD